MQASREILGAEGPLAHHIPGFAPRQAQQEMAEAVEQAIANSSLLIAEAGTGTGKTFAYLVPALLSGEKVIISTGTKNLQDQLFHKDLPVVRNALGVPVTVAMLKGRGNYLCTHRLDLAEDQGRFTSRKQLDQLLRIRSWSGRTRSGDTSEMDDIPEDAPVWGMVTSNADNCLGQECPDFSDCHVMRARRKAQEADVVVVNHHLLFADMALREGGFGEILPSANALILDEAHQLPDVASSFFGQSVTGNQLLELARDTISEDLQEAGEDKTLQRQADKLQKTVQEMRLAFGQEQRRSPWRTVANEPAMQEAVGKLHEALQELQQLLEPQAQRGKGLENCLKRCSELLERFGCLTGDSPEEHIHWFETYKRSFSLHLTPLNIATIFRDKVQQRNTAWIFTSATLAVGSQFDYFSSRMGLSDAETCRWDSPFDYPRQAVLYVPEQMPDPAASGYTEAVLERAQEVIRLSQGRAFILFTSHRALQWAAQQLKEKLEYPLLVQGEMPRSHLLERFRELGNAVLLGTSSFWEGVDVRGEALSCVIIDKLPFASPGDPVTEARIDALRARGGNPFMEFQLPEAVLTLKQGAGRLIRDDRDRGAL
ncbi:MAG TPA: ATP-dependent DNA helicase, partial [Gammaproteobacteria bacterium]|nr:ATP-dependent DNA helicase [Gammaproteobacteria bacterium]